MGTTKEMMAKRIIFIKDNLHLSNVEIGEALKTSAHSIRLTMQRNNIKRPEELLAAIRSKHSSEIGKKMHEIYDFTKENNPNWKGGISKNAYHYKKLSVQRYPEKDKARRKVHYAVSYGHLKRMPCEVCGDEQSHAHHEDYSKPLEVRWLCRKHHREEHDNKH